MANTYSFSYVSTEDLMKQLRRSKDDEMFLFQMAKICEGKKDAEAAYRNQYYKEKKFQEELEMEILRREG